MKLIDVETDNLPQDINSLHTRILHLCSLLWFHEKQMKKYQRIYWREATTGGQTGHVLPSENTMDFQTKNIFFGNRNLRQYPKILYGKVLGELMKLSDISTRPLTVFFSVPKDFSEAQRLKYHVDAYNHVQAEIERIINLLLAE